LDDATFEQYLGGPNRDFAVDEAAECVKRMLEKFERSRRVGLPQPLAEAFESAVSLTNTCHKYCQAIVNIADRALSIPNASLEDRLKLAKNYADKTSAKNVEHTTDVVYLRIRELRQKAFGGILKVINNNYNDEDLKASLDGLFADEDEFGKAIGPTQFAYLWKTKENFDLGISLTGQAANMILVWRSLFYGCVVGERGSALRSSLKKKGFAKLLKDIGADAFLHLLNIPNVVEIGKQIFDLFGDSQLKMLEDMAKNSRDATNYINIYNIGASIWLLPIAQILDASEALISKTEAMLAIEA
jgi:hypothetical protein